MNKLHQDIIELSNKHYPVAKIAKQLDCHITTVSRVRTKYKGLIEKAKDTDVIIDIKEFDNIVPNKLKTTIIKIGNILSNKNLQKESSTQLAKTMGILIDKLRLLEGKSTENILIATYNNLPQHVKNVIDTDIDSYKQARLNKHE